MSNVISVGQISLTDLNDGISSTSPPTSPSVGNIWIDLSTDPVMVKRWNGTIWVDIGELDPDLSETISIINITLGNMTNDNKIDFNERQIIKDRLIDIVGTIITDTQSSLPTSSQLDSGIKGSFYTVRQSALNAGIKSSNSKYITVETVYNNLRTYLQGLTPIKPWNVSSSDSDKVINVVKDDFRNRWLQYYLAIEDLSNETAKQLKQNVDELKIESRNLLLGTIGEKTGNLASYHISDRAELIRVIGEEVTISFDARKKDAGNHVIDCYLRNMSSSSVIQPSSKGYTIDQNWSRISYTLIVPSEVSTIDSLGVGIRGNTSAGGSSGSGNLGDIVVKNAKLQIGSRDTGWTPAPEERQQQLDGLDQKIVDVEFEITDSAIVSKVTSSQSWSTLNNTVNGKASTSQAQGYANTAETNAKNHANNLNSSMNTRMTSAEQQITDSAIVSKVTSSQSWSTLNNTVNGKASTSQAQGYANTAETNAKNHANNLNSSMNTRMTSAEQKITDSAIISTVITSTQYANNLENIRNTIGNLVRNPEVTGNNSGWNGGSVLSVSHSFEGLSTLVLRNTSETDSITYSEWFEVDPSKAYEMTVWVRKNANRGRIYFGLHGSDSKTGTSNNVPFGVVTRTGVKSADSSNFYFFSLNRAPTEWERITGYLMPSGITPSDMSGLGTTNVTSNAIMKPNLKRVRLRLLNYTNGGISTYLYVAMPKVVEISSDSVSRITQLSDSIELKVSGSDYTGNNIMSMLRQTATTIQLLASKIDFGNGDLVVQNNIVNIKSLNVNKLIGNTSSFVQSSWNSVSTSVKINSSGLETYSGSSRTSLLDGLGHRFYRDGLYIGNIGTAGWVGNSSYRGLLFSLENRADYMTWAFRRNASDSNPTTMLAWHKTSLEDTKGFNFYDDITVSPLYTLALRRLSTTNIASGDRVIEFINYTFDSQAGVALVYGREGSYGSRLQLTSTGVRLVNRGNAYLHVTQDSTSNYIASIDIHARTYTSDTQRVRVTSNGVLGRITSSRRYKLLEEEIPLEYAEKIYGINIKSWFDKQIVEDYSEYLTRGGDYEKIEIRRIPGIIAEDVHDLGLNMFVEYDDKGRPDGLSSNLWTLLIPLTKKHRDNINDLGIDIGLLKIKYNDLESRYQDLKNDYLSLEHRVTLLEAS